MVAAFAEENGLATIVGTKTPGRLLSGSRLRRVWLHRRTSSRCLSDMGGKADRRQRCDAECPGRIVAGRTSGGEDPQMQKALELAREL